MPFSVFTLTQARSVCPKQAVLITIEKKTDLATFFIAFKGVMPPSGESHEKIARIYWITSFEVNVPAFDRTLMKYIPFGSCDTFRILLPEFVVPE
jgi:hypothetical protein